MEDELQDYQEEQKKASQETKTFRDKLTEAARKVGIELPQNTEKGKDSLKEFEGAALATGAAIAGVVTAMVNMTLEVGQSAEEIK